MFDLMPNPVLVICAGNLCRSPFAAAYLARRFAEEGIEREVFSRGLLALPGRKPPKEAIEAAQAFGVDLRGHVSQPLLAPDLDRAAIVWVMERRQRRHLAKMRPAHLGKVFLLSEPCGGGDIPDPMGKPRAVFDAVYRQIADCIERWLPQLQTEAAASPF